MGANSIGLKPVVLSAWLLLATLAVWGSYLSGDDRIAALISGLLLGISMVYSRYRLGLHHTSGPMLYLLLFGLFHLGLLAPWATGLYKEKLPTWFAPGELMPAIVLVTLSIAAYQTGLLAATPAANSPKTFHSESGHWTEEPGIFYAGLFLFIVGVGMFLWGLMSLDPAGYYQFTYADTFRLRAEADPRFFGSGITFASIGLYLAAAGAPKVRVRFALTSAVFWILALLYLGFRGPALIVGLVVYSVGVKKGLKIPKWFPWFAVAFLLIAIPVIKRTRHDPFDQRALPERRSEVHVLDALVEMGGSIRPLIETEAALHGENYRYGKTYLAALPRVIPNLALSWSPPPATSLEDLAPNHWVTAIAEPLTYKNHGGIGFSATAEPYMNFGYVGVVLYFFTLGFLLTRLDRNSFENPYALAAWALVLGPLLWTTRNDFHNFVRPAFWGLAYLGIVWLLIKHRFLPTSQRVSSHSPRVSQYPDRRAGSGLL